MNLQPRRQFLNTLAAATPLTIGEKVMRASKRVKRRGVIKAPKQAADREVRMIRVMATSPPRQMLAPPTPVVGMPPLMAHIVRQSGSTVLSWSGPAPPYQIQRTPVLPPVWSDYGPATVATSRVIDTPGQQAYFRVKSFVGAANGTLNPNGTAHLKWIPPATN